MSIFRVFAIAIFVGIATASSAATSCSESPCHNGAICKDYVDQDYICECDGAWTGKNCDIPITFCKPDSCSNGAKCVNDFSTDLGYRCECPSGYFGPKCERRFLDYVGPNAVCKSFDCHNGGVCVQRKGQPMCDCPTGFSGFRCETNDNPDMMTVNFENNDTTVSKNAESLTNYTVLPIWQFFVITVVVTVVFAIGVWHIKRCHSALRKKTLLPTSTPTTPSPDTTVSTFDDSIHQKLPEFYSSAPGALKDSQKCSTPSSPNSRSSRTFVPSSPNTIVLMFDDSEAVPLPNSLELCYSTQEAMTNCQEGFSQSPPNTPKAPRQPFSKQRFSVSDSPNSARNSMESCQKC